MQRIPDMPLPPLPSLFSQPPPPAAEAARAVPPLLLPRAQDALGASDSASSASSSGAAAGKSKKRPRAAAAQSCDKENAAPRAVDVREKSGNGGRGAGGARPRKPTYLLQKEERDVLLDDVHALEEQLEALRLRVGLPTRDDRAVVAAIEAKNFEIEEQIHASRLYLAKLQSMVMNELHTPPVDPLATYIHLPRDTEQRRAILTGMRELKLRRAEEVAHDRLHHLDHTQAYLSEERFTTDDGSYHCHRLEINQFPNFRSARQLYDALSIFFYNWEISVSEMLDQLAIREDSDEIDPTIWNQRIVTVADDVGCTEELNTAVFARFRTSEDGGSPVGTITFDTVDQDDLYPYKPLERTCKLFQAVHLVYELDVPGASRPLPILKSCSFVKQLPPQFELAPGVEEKLHQHVSRWPVTLLKFLRAYRAPETM